jgi:hypothetical protein
MEGGNGIASVVRDKHGLQFDGMKYVRKPFCFKSPAPTPAPAPRIAELPAYEQDEELAEAVCQDEFDNVTADIRQDIADAVAQGTKVVGELRGEISALRQRVLELEHPLIRVKLGPPVPAFDAPVPPFGRPECLAPVYPPKPPLQATHVQSQVGGRVTSGFELPRNHGKYWTWSDEQWLRNAYVGGVRLSYLCGHLGRTPFAVFMKLVKLELVSENNVFTLWEEGVDTYSRGSYV